MDIIKLVHKALSDADIRAILGENTKIIKYSELSGYRDLDDLLPNFLDYVISFYMSTQKTLAIGWRYLNIIIYLNSLIPMGT